MVLKKCSISDGFRLGSDRFQMGFTEEFRGFRFCSKGFKSVYIVSRKVLHLFFQRFDRV